MIEAAPSGTTAKATTYFTGLHFGKGKWEGKELTAWGKYEDELVLDQGGEASGDGLYRKWLINRRVVHFMGRQGEEGVMQGE